MNKLLDQFVEKLKSAAGDNLKAVVLYGSAAGGNYHEKHSDLNVLCLVDKAGSSELESLAPAAQWWMRKGHPSPLIFTADELQRSAEVFAIELGDIRDRHQMLLGEDFITTFQVPMNLHRWQVKRELRAGWLRLRQAILSAPKKRAAQLAIMTASISTFATLFRHALIALGEPVPMHAHAVFDQVGELVSANPAPFHTILEFREGKKKAADVDVYATLRAYLDFVHRVTNEFDRRISSSSSDRA
jgi:predicted nucleotidyltransferase